MIKGCVNDNEKLIEAVKTIKGVCEGRQYEEDCCEGCPFGDSDGECLIINSSPDCWKLVKNTQILV
ncbi:hypothetical protein [Clostridium sardiniense]|uniref:hypothetical protein n=1 Tax=Clostridium sardiniense TaxID=29369 RepID=UPI00195E6F47|nr:hypothetical protein [Clostridium sardiniense]MBM7836465.1 hypothetical protein [Clostridium sardiniense]